VELPGSVTMDATLPNRHSARGRVHSRRRLPSNVVGTMRFLADQSPSHTAWRVVIAAGMVVLVSSCSDAAPSENAHPDTVAIASSVPLPTTIPVRPATTATTSTTSTSTTTTTTTTIAVSTQPTLGVPTPTGPQASSEFCQAALEAERSSRAIDELGDTPQTTPEQIVQAYKALKSAANHAFDTAPAELERATAIMKSVFNEVDALMAEHGYNPQATFTDPRYEDLTQRAEQPEVVAANEDYQNFLTSQCGIGQ